MSIFDNYGEMLLRQHEGNRQIASVLAAGAQALGRRLAKLLTAMRRHRSGGHPLG